MSASSPATPSPCSVPALAVHLAAASTLLPKEIHAPNPTATCAPTRSVRTETSNQAHTLETWLLSLGVTHAPRLTHTSNPVPELDILTPTTMGRPGLLPLQSLAASGPHAALLEGRGAPRTETHSHPAIRLATFAPVAGANAASTKCSRASRSSNVPLARRYFPASTSDTPTPTAMRRFMSTSHDLLQSRAFTAGAFIAAAHFVRFDCMTEEPWQEQDPGQCGLLLDRFFGSDWC